MSHVFIRKRDESVLLRPCPLSQLHDRGHLGGIYFSCVSHVAACYEFFIYHVDGIKRKDKEMEERTRRLLKDVESRFKMIIDSKVGKAKAERAAKES